LTAVLNPGVLAASRFELGWGSVEIEPARGAAKVAALQFEQTADKRATIEFGQY
jgi:hypothetical protein